jgi:predicted regulator of Ras-like GTPase activity (Roadblock/LC7/MglB family)
VFREFLKALLADVPGARSATVMGFDGIAIDTSDSSAADGNEQAAAVEVAAVTSQLRRAAEGLNAGEVTEVTLETEGLTTILRPITDEYVLAVSLTAGGWTGKARYLMRIAAPKLALELS